MPARRGIVVTRKPGGRTLEANGRTWRYFSGTHYLGIQTDREFIDLVGEGLSRWGTHFGGSRRSNLQLAVYEEAEQVLAQITGAESALMLASGTTAGQLLIHSLFLTDHLYYGPNTHPALLLPGARPVEDWDIWLERLHQDAGDWQKPVSLVFNRMDPLMAKPAPVDWLRELPAGFEYRVVVDDSHYLGVMGEEGGGSYRDLDLPAGCELIVLSSLGKAMGLPAGCILGRRDRISGLWNSALFGGASPPSPAFLHAFISGQAIYRKARFRLQENIRLWESLIPDRELFSGFPDYPVYYTPHQGLAGYLQEKEVLISSFPYPGPDDNLITRVVLNAVHTAEDLEYLAVCLKAFKP